MAFMLLLFISFAASLGVGSLLVRHANRLKLVQTPNHRSSHLHPTPTGGGLGIIIATTGVGIYLAWISSSQLWVVLGLALPLAIVGLIDDIRHVSARIRFGLHIAVSAGFLIFLVPQFQWSLFGNSALDCLILFGLLLFAGTWWINLFNFMDGLDGLAGAQAFSMLFIAAILALSHPTALHNPLWILMLCTTAAILGFLILNWAPAKIFMGDAGSTWLGFLIFALALLTIQRGWLNYAAWLILGAPFITDATITLLTRMRNGERWYEAHRNHVFQRLSRHWQSDRKSIHRSVTALFVILNLLLAPLAWACLQWPAWSILWLSVGYIPLIIAAFLLGAGKPD